MNKIFFFIFYSTFLFAQDISFQIERSQLFEDDYKDSEIVLAEKSDKDEFIIVRSYKSGVSVKRGFYIEKYNKSLNRKSAFDFEIEHSNNEKYSLFLGSFFYDAKVYIFEIFYDLKSKNYICRANIIDEKYRVSKQELFQLSKDEVKGFGLQNLYYDLNYLDLNKNNLGLFELEEKSSYSFLYGNVSSKVSNDNSRSNVVFKVNNKKTLFSIAMTFQFRNEDFTKLFLFDSNLNKKIEKDFLFEKDKVINKNIELHDSLNIIYLTQKVFLDELKKKETGGKYIYEIKKITPEEVKTKKIEVENHYLTSLTSFCFESTLYGIGFYSDKDDFKYSGISFFELDSQNLEIKNSKYNPFTEQFIIDKYGKLKNKEFKNIVINGLYRNEKNDICINAEEVYKTSGEGGTFNNYDDIVSINLNSKGELLTAKNINKTQSVSYKENSSFLSYSSSVLNNKNYFFINAKDQIKELSTGRIEFKGANTISNSSLYIISRDNEGDFGYKEVLNNEQTEVPFMVSKGITIDNSIIFLGRKGKKKQLLKITL